MLQRAPRPMVEQAAANVTALEGPNELHALWVHRRLRTKEERAGVLCYAGLDETIAAA